MNVNCNKKYKAQHVIVVNCNLVLHYQPIAIKIKAFYLYKHSSPLDASLLPTSLEWLSLERKKYSPFKTTYSLNVGQITARWKPNNDSKMV